MSGPDRLQPGIGFRSGQKPPACFRLQLMNIAAGTSGADAADAVARVLAAAGGVSGAAGRAREESVLHDGLEVLIGYGRRFFDDAVHSPVLTEHTRPPYLAYLDQRGHPFPSVRWRRSPPSNRGEADLAFQITAPQSAGAACAAVRMWQQIVEDGLPLQPSASFEGFGRPDGRGWLGFHDGVSNMASSQRRTAIETTDVGSPLRAGTTMAFLRLRVDLALWDRLTRAEQEVLVGRDKDSGAPPGAAADDVDAFRDPPETAAGAEAMSHVHRANQSRASPAAPGALRIFRQGYDYLDDVGPEGPDLGLNFVSFQADLAALQHLLHLPGWFGDVNFGGPPGPDSPALFALADGGFYVVPPTAEPFPGADLFAHRKEHP
jgi:deferrochelatase/peroxidase EfeB